MSFRPVFPAAERNPLPEKEGPQLYRWINKQAKPLLTGLVEYANRSDAVNVTLAGAVSSSATDPVDVTAQVQALLAEVDAIYFPPGFFVVTQLLIRSGQSVTGAGPGSTTIYVADGTNATTFASYDEDEPVTDVVISGFTLDGNSTNQSANPTGNSVGAGIGLRGPQRFTYRDLVIQNTRSDGVLLTETTANDAATYGTIENVSVINYGRNGIAATHAAYISIKGCHFSDATANQPGDGIDLEPNGVGLSCHDIWISDCSASNIYGCGVRIYGDSAVNVYDVAVRRMKIDGAAKNPLAATDGHEDAGIICYYSKGCSFEDIVIDGCGATVAGPTDVGDGILLYGFNQLHHFKNCRIGIRSGNRGYGFRELTDGVNAPDYTRLTRCAIENSLTAAKDKFTLVGGNSKYRDCDDQRGRNLSNIALKGSWTPTVQGGTIAGTPAGSFAYDCTYTRSLDENLVFVRGYISWTGHTGTGNIQIGGLPYTSNSTANREHVWAVATSTLAFTNNITMLLAENRSFALLIDSTSGAGRSTLTFASAGADGTISFSGWYEPADF